MASRQSTPSEGEILESDSEKATKSLPSRNGISVDRQSRKRHSSSPSPSPVSSPRRNRSRTKSRSPLRESRGTKRAREDDYFRGNDRRDSRRFRVHYEDSYYSDRRPDGFARGNDRNRHSIPNPQRPNRGDRVRHSYDTGERVRSRSPQRSAEKGLRYGGHGRDRGTSHLERYPGHGRKEDEYQERRNMRSREQSVSDRGISSFATAPSRHEAEIRINQTQQDRSKAPRDEATNKYVPDILYQTTS